MIKKNSIAGRQTVCLDYDNSDEINTPDDCVTAEGCSSSSEQAY